jgi:hypothetical protein
VCSYKPLLEGGPTLARNKHVLEEHCISKKIQTGDRVEYTPGPIASATAATTGVEAAK